MPHNGGLLQINPSFLQIGNDFAFLNAVKHGQEWSLVDNSGAPSPNTLSANGYPINISNGGVYTRTFVALQADRPGRYVCRFSGGGTIYRNFTHTVDNGSVTNLLDGVWSGQEGRFVCTLTGNAANVDGTIDIGISAIDPGNPITNLWFCHEDDEALLDAGQIFGTKFKQRLIELGIGVFRNLDWALANTTNVVKWGHRKPVDYVFYHGSEFRSSVFAGTTSNVGNAYAVAAPSDWGGLVHGALVTLRFNAASSSEVCTLNVGSTGDVPIKFMTGNTLYAGNTVQWPAGGRIGTLVYDADLACWLKLGGDTEAFNKGLENGVPPEITIRLCEEMGMHYWSVQPPLSADPPSNYMSSEVTYLKDRPSQSWMVPRYELVSNEDWNFSTGFPGTRYGWNKTVARWGVQDTNNYHGRAFSLVAATIWDAYGVSSKQPDRFHLVCGVQTVVSPSLQIARLESTRHVADNPGVNKPAWLYATHVAQTNYWNSPLTVTQELALAFEYNTANDLRQAAILAQVVGFGPDSNYLTIVSNWSEFASGYGADLCAYEGGYSPDYPTADTTSGVTAILRGATTEISTSGELPPVGSSVSYISIGGTTGLNGNTYTVTASGPGKYTINADSSGMGAWTSGGTATYVNSQTLRTALRLASKQAPDLEAAELLVIQKSAALGLKNPSQYSMAGKSAWAMYDPNIYYESPRSRASQRYKAKERLLFTVVLV